MTAPSSSRAMSFRHGDVGCCSNDGKADRYGGETEETLELSSRQGRMWNGLEAAPAAALKQAESCSAVSGIRWYPIATPVDAQA